MATDKRTATVAKATPAELTEFNPRDPQTLLATAQQLAQFVRDNHLASTIQNRSYVQAEGWQFLFAVAGLDVICSKPTRLERATEVCYEAEARLFDATGREVGYGYAICSDAERLKKGWAEYAIASMAQTRAIGKAGRNRFAFVMKAAGFEPTPAEEMSEVGTGASVVEPRMAYHNQTHNPTLEPTPKKPEAEASASASAAPAASDGAVLSIAGPAEVPAWRREQLTRQFEAVPGGIELKNLWGSLTKNEATALFDVKEAAKLRLAQATQQAADTAARTMRVAGENADLVAEFTERPTLGTAVVTYATQEQKETITRLLDHSLIARKEKTMLLLGINKLDKERARQAIIKLRTAIAEREGTDPLVGARAQVVSFVQRNAGKLSATQAEGLTSLAASPEATLEFLLDALELATQALIDDETYGTDEELSALEPAETAIAA